MVWKKARAPPISQGIIQQDASPIMLSNYFLWNEQFKEIKIEDNISKRISKNLKKNLNKKSQQSLTNKFNKTPSP